MTQFFHEYAAFNLWASQRICSVLEKISDEQFEREVMSSFPSIRKTTLHVWGANQVWIKRTEGISLRSMPTENFNGTRMDILNGFIESCQRLIEVCESQSEESLLGELKYSNLKGENFSSSLYHIFAHVFNHATYHRGQLVTMLRQVGVIEIPSTDFTTFYREKK